MLIEHQCQEGSVTIAASESESEAIDISNCLIMSVTVPASMTGTALNFKAGQAGYEADVYIEGSLAETPIPSGGGTIEVPTAALKARSLILVSNDTEAASRTIRLNMKS